MNLFLKIIFAGSFSLLIFSCGRKEEEVLQIPPDVLSEDSLTILLTDFALAESAASMNVKNVPLQKIDSVYAFNPIKENGITRARFDSSLSFYSRYPETYKRVYDNVVIRLSEMQAKRNPAKKDSTLK
jgi:hypothetical protein